MSRRPAAVLLLLGACGGPEAVDPCVEAGADATSRCVAPTLSPAAYVAASDLYFDTMDSRFPDAGFPPYAELAARWEWPPWLRLTGFGRDVLESGDTLLRAYPSVVVDRDCRAFDTQPFGRCRVTFVYDARPEHPCPIYEEFTFSDAGELTFIEAWSDLPGLRPMADDDPWAEADDVPRLSTRIPGLGGPGGRLDLDGDAMRAAADADADVADFARRAADFFGTWAQEQATVGDQAFVLGCGG